MAVRIAGQDFRAATARCQINLHIPEEVLDRIAARPEVDAAHPQQGFANLMNGVEEWVKDNFADALEYAQDEPEVEADA